MGNPVVHFEIIGSDPATLRSYYGDLFGWRFAVGGAVADGISASGEYGFVDHDANNDGVGIPGGIGGGEGYGNRALFYIGVPDVEAALAEAERLGGTRVLGPAGTPGGDLVVGHFTDPEGNLIGVAGLA